MYQLTQIFKKYLREYAGKILEQKIPKATAQASSLGWFCSSISFFFPSIFNATFFSKQVQACQCLQKIFKIYQRQPEM